MVVNMYNSTNIATSLLVVIKILQGSAVTQTVLGGLYLQLQVS